MSGPNRRFSQWIALNRLRENCGLSFTVEEAFQDEMPNPSNRADRAQKGRPTWFDRCVTPSERTAHVGARFCETESSRGHSEWRMTGSTPDAGGE